MSAHKHDIDVKKTAARVLDAVLALGDRGGIPENEESVAAARAWIEVEVAAVAERVAEDGCDPSPADLAARLSEAEWSDVVLSLGDDVFHKRRNTAPLVVAVIALAVLLIAAIWAFTSSTPADAPDRPPKVDLVIDAGGIAGGAELPGTLELAGSGDPVSLEFDSDRLSLGELEPGDYTVTLVETPVLEDGTTFAMADEATFTVEAEDGEREVPVKLDAVKVEDLSDETRLDLADRAEKAHAEDLTALLRGDGAAVNPDESAQPEDAPADEPAADPDGGSSAQKPADKPQKGDKPSKPAGGQTSSKPSGGSYGGGASKPSHKHTWVEQTAQKWVPNNVWVVDKPAWDEKVPGKSFIRCSCGGTFNTNADWSAHAKSAALAGDLSHTSSVVTGPGTTIHHDEVGHWEDRGYNETVVTGYACSGCGAKK